MMADETQQDQPQAGTENSREKKLADLFRKLEAALQLFDADNIGERENAFRSARGLMGKINALHAELGYQSVSFRQIFDQAAKGGSVAGTAEDLQNTLLEFEQANAELKDNESRLLARIDRLETLLESFKTKAVRQLVAEGLIDRRTLRKGLQSVDAIETTMATVQKLVSDLRQIGRDAEIPGAYPAMLDRLLADDLESLTEGQTGKNAFTGYLVRLAGLPADPMDLTILRHTLKAQKEVISAYGQTVGEIDKIEEQLKAVREGLDVLKASGARAGDPEELEKLKAQLAESEAENAKVRGKLAEIESIEARIEKLNANKETLEKACETLKKLKDTLSAEYGRARDLHTVNAHLQKQIKALAKGDTASLVEELEQERAKLKETTETLGKAQSDFADLQNKYGTLEGRLAKWVTTDEKMAKELGRFRWITGFKLAGAFALAAGTLATGAIGTAFISGLMTGQWMTALMAAGSTAAVTFGLVMGGYRLLGGPYTSWRESAGVGALAAVPGFILGGIGGFFAFGFAGPDQIKYAALPERPAIIEQAGPASSPAFHV